MQDQVRQILSIYCLCDDFLRAWGHKDAPQAKMTTAQVMTVALVAVTLFNGNQERSRCFLQEHGYIPKMLSKGAFNRRLHEVTEAVWQALFKLLADVHKQLNEAQEYAVDSLPVPVCDNIAPTKPPHPALSPLSLSKTGQESPGQESQQPEAGEKAGEKARRLPWLHRQQEALLLRAESPPAGNDERPAGRSDAGRRQ